ncbi:MAG: hypothetical protein AAFN30_17015 [Actinomycetota bacterium]
MKRSKLVAATTGLALAVSACGGGYDRQETIDELVTESGVEESVAICIVDELEAQIGEERLGSRDDPTPEEEALIVDVSTECLLASLDG